VKGPHVAIDMIACQRVRIKAKQIPFNFGSPCIKVFPPERLCLLG